MMQSASYSKLVRFLQEDLHISSSSMAIAFKYIEQDPGQLTDDSVAVWFSHAGAIRPNLRLDGNSLIVNLSARESIVCPRNWTKSN